MWRLALPPGVRDARHETVRGRSVSGNDPRTIGVSRDARDPRSSGDAAEPRLSRDAGPGSHDDAGSAIQEGDCATLRVPEDPIGEPSEAAGKDQHERDDLRVRQAISMSVDMTSPKVR